MPAPPTANKATKLIAGTLVAGRYRIVREIGRGGMAHVYEAKHVDIGKSVAVKVLAAEFITSPVVVERFLREARAAAAVRSPYICDVYDSGKLDDGRPFLVMELLEGESLYERMVRVRQFDPKTTVRIITHVARGLMKAHAAGIVHRDLKPENIFLTTNEDGEMHAKVLDFGLAKFYAPSNDGNAAQARLTREGAIFGTPAYMSPEQVQGQGTVDLRADVWALGCIAYEALTGRTVWATDKGIAMTFAQIASAPIPQLTTYRPDLPRSADDWLARALSREVEGRYQNAKELADALAQTLDQGPPSVLFGGEPSSQESVTVRQLPSDARDELLVATPSPPATQVARAPTPPMPPVGSPQPTIESLTNETVTTNTLKGSTLPQTSPTKPLLLGGALVVLITGIGLGAWQVHRTQNQQALSQPQPHGSAAASEQGIVIEGAPSAASPAASSELAASGPRWAPLVTEGQQLIAAGNLDEAARKFKEAQDNMGSAVARAMNEHVATAQANKGPCRLSALARLRPFSLVTGNAGRPSIEKTERGLVTFWTDDHESPSRDHTYALVLDPQTLKPLGPPVDVTPDAEKVGRFATAVLGDKIALVYTDTRGTSPGLFVRWLGADGRIKAPRVTLAPARASGAQPSLWAEEAQLLVGWDERADTDKTDLYYARITPDEAPSPGVRLTDLRRGTHKPRVAVPTIASIGGSIEALFRVDRDTQRPITYLHVPAGDPQLASGVQLAALRVKDDGAAGHLRVLAPLKEKGDVASYRGDTPGLVCGAEGCFAVWHVERNGRVGGGWFAAQLDAHNGEALWSKKFPGGGSRPAIGSMADGAAMVSWYEGGKVRIASIGRDNVGLPSSLAHVAGDQPPATLVGLGGNQWAVAWLDFEGGRLEPYALRATCQ